MPQKNVAKQYVANNYYHVYNHAVSNEMPMNNDSDKQLFLKLLARYLGDRTQRDQRGMYYPNLNSKLKLLAFCLLPNHFHLLFYLEKNDGITDLMRRVITAFAKIKNKEQGRRGTLFETTFKAAKIDNEMYLTHISRYIHLNPLDIGMDYSKYNYSSYLDYVNEKRFPWLNNEILMSMFGNNKTELEQFTKSGVEYHLTRK